jgi:hypothetical protein
MAEMFTAGIRGARAAQRELRKLTPALRKRVLRNAMSAGGGVIKRAMKTGSPKETGLLARSWIVGRPKVDKRGTVRLGVKPNSKLVRVIRRTATGRLVATSKKKTLEAQSAAKGRKVKGRRRPAFYAFPLDVRESDARGYARDAFNSGQRQAIEKARAKIKEGAEREARKSNRRTKGHR